MISTFKIESVPTLKEKNCLQEETFSGSSQVEKGFVKRSKAKKTHRAHAVPIQMLYLAWWCHTMKCQSVWL